MRLFDYTRKTIAALLLMASLPMSADNYAYLTVAQTDGEKNYSVSEIDKITFESSSMVLHLQGGTEQRLPLASLKKMFFSGDATAIAANGKSQSAMTIDGGVMRISVAEGERVSIYDMKGEQLLSTTTDATLDMSRMQHGVYIVKMGCETRKFITK